MKFYYISLLSLLFFLQACQTATFEPNGASVEQKSIARVETMPNLPQPLDIPDWRRVALDFDSLVFDHTLTGDQRPLIWLDSSRRNFDQVTFGIYTALGDIRQGPSGNIEGHEALGSLGALLGATLVGIDKSNQDGYNYVNMARNYFNRESGWDIIQNFTSKAGHIGGGYGNDWWYDLYNNVLFYAVANYYPEQAEYDPILRRIADQIYQADSILAGNYSYSYFDFGQMKPMTNHIVAQEDAAAAHAFILFSAYKKFGDPKYLQSAHNALTALSQLEESRFYEILLPFAAYVGARMNAEQGDSIEIQKFLNWTFDGTATNRIGWGVINERWGGYDVHGLVGSTVHNGGYAFLMNTFDLAWPLTAMVRYDQRYARTVGKWLLNAANAARLFYPEIIPDSLQALPHLKPLCGSAIAYEGLIKESTFDEFKGITPFAQGDGPNWAPGMPDETMFSVYGSGHVGVFGGIIQQTDVPGILQLDCGATDMYTTQDPYPTHLLYNPYPESRQVTIQLEDAAVDLYDMVSQKILLKNVTNSASIELATDQAILIVSVPSGSKFRAAEGKLYAGDIIIDYRYRE